MRFHSCCRRSSSGRAVLPAPPCHARASLSCPPPSVIPAAPPLSFPQFLAGIHKWDHCRRRKRKRLDSRLTTSGMTEREPCLFILVVRGRLQVTLSFLRLPVLPAPSVLPTPYPVIPAAPPLSCPQFLAGIHKWDRCRRRNKQTAGFPIKDVGNDSKRVVPFHSCCERSSSGHAILPAPPWPSRPFGPSHPLSCHSCIPPSVIPAPPLSFPQFLAGIHK